jgi:glucokinase
MLFRYYRPMFLAGDVGGTKTLLGLFRPPDDRGSSRPEPLVTREYVTLEFDSLDEVVHAFVEETNAPRVAAAVIGVAGPVTGHVARLTNVPWAVDVSAMSGQLGGCPALLLNDLEAMGSAVPILEPDELATLQAGVPVPTGNGALIAAGTGLGEALLHNLDGQFRPAASEGGHADFAARTPRELALVDELTRIYGRVSNERVISGHGLVNVFRFTHGTQDLAHACRIARPTPGATPREAELELPAEITASAMAGRCEQCVEALDMFVEAYGAEAGNLGLRTVALGGVYIGGGIAPKILPALERGAFMEAFRGKTPMVDLLRTLPVHVILNPRAALLGAAARAMAMGQ